MAKVDGSSINRFVFRSPTRPGPFSGGPMSTDRET